MGLLLEAGPVAASCHRGRTHSRPWLPVPLCQAPAGAGVGPSGGCSRPACVPSGPWCCALRLGCGVRTEQGAREGRAQPRPPLPVPPREGGPRIRAWQVCRGQPLEAGGGTLSFPRGAGPGPGCGRVEVTEGAEIMTSSGQCMAHQQSCGGRLWPQLCGPSSTGWGWGHSALLPAPQHEPSSQLCGEGSWQPASLL